jgi:hypothetical protein
LLASDKFKGQFTSWGVLMGNRRFLSWPAGWRKAFPWGVLFGVLVVAVVIVVEVVRSGWDSLDRIFWIDLVVCFPIIVVGFTALAARFWVSRNGDDKPDS